MLKKGASFTLTSLRVLRHNRLVCEKAAIRKSSRTAIEVWVTTYVFVLQSEIDATIDSNGIDAIRGLFGPRVAFFVFRGLFVFWD
jgi:hypothetical protein